PLLPIAGSLLPRLSPPRPRRLLFRPEPRAFRSIRHTLASPSRKSRFQNSTRNRVRFQVSRHPATRISKDECRRVLWAAFPFRHSSFGIESSFVLRHFDLEFWDAPFFYPC